MESYEILWNNTLKELENTVSTISYSTYISALTPVDMLGEKLVLSAPNELFAKQISSSNLADKIRQALTKTESGLTDFTICTGEYKPAENPEPQSSPINPAFTFDSFVVGPSNEYVHAAGKAVAENPGDIYNPLFIYGGTGLGKTHMLMAIANYIRLHSPSLKVLYATCEQFTNEMIESISRGANKGPEFRNKYRNIDVLLIDDVQFLAKKTGVQTEFFNTFNELVLHNKQVVLTSDRSPGEIELLEDRLRTRFEGGLLADIQPPDIETRIAILKRKSEEMKSVIDIKVLTYIAETGSDDVRTLIGRLKNVIFYSKLHERKITVELVAEALKESFINSAGDEAIKIEDIIKCVCDDYKIDKSDLVGKKKNKTFVEPRQICIYLICELMNIPLVTIGHEMGGRDHTTVIYARDKVAELIRTNPLVERKVNDLKNMILKQ